MALGATHGWSTKAFQDTPLPLNRTRLPLSCRLSEHHLWMWNTTIQRKFEALLHQICEPLSIIELPDKGEGLLSSEKVAYKWWLPRSCVQPAAWSQTVRPRHRPLSSPFYQVSRDQNTQGSWMCQLSNNIDLPMLLPMGLSEKNTQQEGQGEDILKPFFLEDFRTHPSTVNISKARGTDNSPCWVNLEHQSEKRILNPLSTYEE